MNRYFHQDTLVLEYGISVENGQCYVYGIWLLKSAVPRVCVLKISGYKIKLWRYGSFTIMFGWEQIWSFLGYRLICMWKYGEPNPFLNVDFLCLCMLRGLSNNTSCHFSCFQMSWALSFKIYPALSTTT